MAKPSTPKRSSKTTKTGHSSKESGHENSKGNQAVVEPRSLGVAIKGVKTGADFASLMSALMSDVIEGTIDPSVANAACNAGGKLLKIVEMQHRVRRGPQESTPEPLRLVG